MSYPVNRPQALAASGVAARLRITVLPPPATALPTDYSGAPAGHRVLTFNDAPDLASANQGNVIWSAPLAGLAGIANRTIDLGTTATGLTVSAVPPGVAATVEFG